MNHRTFTKMHCWTISADIPSPMGKIYSFAKCLKCHIKIKIKYMDIMPWESIVKTNIIEGVPQDQFDMTMAMMNQSNNLSIREKMELMFCLRGQIL